MEAKLEVQEVQLEKQDAELGEQKRLLVKEKEECKDNIQTITQVRMHIVMLQCTIRYEPPNGHTVSHDMGSANSLSQ